MRAVLVASLLFCGVAFVPSPTLKFSDRGMQENNKEPKIPTLKFSVRRCVSRMQANNDPKINQVRVPKWNVRRLENVPKSNAIKESAISFNKAILKCEDVPSVLECCFRGRGMGFLDAFNLATSINKIAKIGTDLSPYTESLQELLTLLNEALDSQGFAFQERQLASIAWSLSRWSRTIRNRTEYRQRQSPLQIKVEVCRFSLLCEVRRRGSLQGFSGQGLSNLIWPYAQDHPEDEVNTPRKDEAVVSWLFAAAAGELATRKLVEFSCRDLSNLAWAFARSGRRDLSLWAILATETSRRGVTGSLHDAMPQELTCLMWGFAKSIQAREMGRMAESPLVLGALAALAKEVSARRPDSYKPQELTNSAWALATVATRIADHEDHDHTVQKLQVGSFWNDAKGLMEYISHEVIRRDLSRFSNQVVLTPCIASHASHTLRCSTHKGQTQRETMTHERLTHTQALTQCRDQRKNKARSPD